MEKVSAVIADDVQEMRLLLRSILRASGCEVLGEASDGESTLEILKRSAPEVLFLDLDMPGMSGMEVLTHLPSLPFSPFTIIVSSDGREEVQRSALAQGAHTYITKPYSQQKITEALQLFSQRRNSTIQHTALIADDEPLMLDLLSNFLSQQSCRVVHAATNGAEVLNYLEQHKTPDFIFLDIDMPTLDGIRTLQKIRANKNNVFCAMVSAHSTIENVKNAMSQGANGFIVKPYTKEKISQILEKFQARK